MCGGRGTRLGGETEKPLREVAGRPMVDRVLDALAESRVEATHAVVSPHATRTRERLAERASERPSLSVVDAPGNGYVADLRYAMDAADADGGPLLTAAADLPLLNGAAVDAVLDAARAAAGDSLTVCVPAARKRELGVSADATTEIDGREVVPAGINVVGRSGESERDDGGAVHLTDDARVAVNVNYPSDVRIAERLLERDSGRHHTDR
ncbi:GTP--adenosylcobinamide-phosphate guanylyltransferase [Halorubrum lipolyticum]|uniref:GTP:adenosylcobinamide-phosphate guanylyltransferase n=1 Tax=Halorubrum lipolyticum DSM 21995 TaxID=1227482 RepID=M0NT51_9EURY|nr:GTP--adenosylcobinamide-phosphate guanylyltransferase [Halorubrum lipolyticum]EMA61122.1 GTP:adenosylcobinamide-phosphate guanylyltransferase [Halorubrum lipolyticum DSM 21995]